MPYAHPLDAGLNCANLTQEVWNSSLDIPVCHLDIPSTCPIADLLSGGPWSGGTSQFRALQLVRAAITNGSASTADPWTNRSPCNATAAGSTSLAGVTCANDTIVGINASAVFACAGPHCTWSGHPWRPVREFADVSTLQVLNLANMGMTGGCAHAPGSCTWGWSLPGLLRASTARPRSLPLYSNADVCVQFDHHATPSSLQNAALARTTPLQARCP